MGHVSLVGVKLHKDVESAQFPASNPRAVLRGLLYNTHPSFWFQVLNPCSKATRNKLDMYFHYNQANVWNNATHIKGTLKRQVK